jgi:hypothetical protein
MTGRKELILANEKPVFDVSFSILMVLSHSGLWPSYGKLIRHDGFARHAEDEYRAPPEINPWSHSLLTRSIRKEINQ